MHDFEHLRYFFAAVILDIDARGKSPLAGAAEHHKIRGRVACTGAQDRIEFAQQGDIHDIERRMIQGD